MVLVQALLIRAVVLAQYVLHRIPPGLQFHGLGLVRALCVLRLGRRSLLWHLTSCAVV